MRKKMEKALEVFGARVNIRELGSVASKLKKAGLTLDDLIEYGTILKKETAAAIERAEKASKRNKLAIYQCPACNSFMVLRSVNTNKGDQTEDDSKSVWLCLNQHCLETIYNKETVDEIHSKGGSQ